MSSKVEAMLSEIETLLSAAKKPKHAIEKDAKGKWRIRSMKDGKLWPQTYDTKEMANKGLAAYHLRKKGVPPKKASASAVEALGWAVKADSSGHCIDCGAPYYSADEQTEGMCSECSTHGMSASVLSAKARKLHVVGDPNKPEKFMVKIAGDPADWRKYVRGTSWHFNSKNEDEAQAFLEKYIADGYHIFVVVEPTAKLRSPLSRVAIVITPSKKVMVYNAMDRKIDGEPYAEFIEVAKKHAHGGAPMSAAHGCPQCGGETKIDMSGASCSDSACGWTDSKQASASVVNALEGGGYKAKYKSNLAKLRHFVDRNYITAEQVAGAIVEALHQSQLNVKHKREGGEETSVTVRLAPAMAIAIANEVQQALSQLEEDVIDVSARAKLRARAKLPSK